MSLLREGPRGRVCISPVNAANDNFGALGYAIIGIFVASWLISLVVYRMMGYDKLTALGQSEPSP